MRNNKFLEKNFASLSSEKKLSQRIHLIVRLTSVNPKTETVSVEAPTLQPLPVSLIDTNTTQILDGRYM